MGERGGASRRQPRWFVVAGGLSLAVAACSNDGSHAPTVRGPAPGDVPGSVTVAGGSISTGVAVGKMRGAETVDPFRISAEPVTVKEYRACVDAGACSEPAVKGPACAQVSRAVLQGATYSVEQGDDLPVTCAAPAQAGAYCAWVGGALPSSAQWQLAARGAAVTRFAWGETMATCANHPDGIAPDGTPCTPSDDFDAVRTAHRVGQHPAGASSAGLQDVLLAPGELVQPSAGALFSSCEPPRTACVAYGLVPGAIDSFEGLSTADGSAPGHTTYAFRCVWSAQ